MAPAGAIAEMAGLDPMEDPEHRYEMPAVHGKIEGSGNGIKTVIPNISNVALSMHRPPIEVIKFVGCALGVQASFSTMSDRAIIGGAHTDAALQHMIHRYVEDFVRCPNCGLLETEYKIKSDTIYHRCAACGATKRMLDINNKMWKHIKKVKRAEKNTKRRDEKDKTKESNKEILTVPGEGRQQPPTMKLRTTKRMQKKQQTGHTSITGNLQRTNRTLSVKTMFPF